MSANATAAPRHQQHARTTARSEFDQWAHSYDRSWLNELVFFPSLRICLEEIHRCRQEFGARPYALLDVGCGTGNLLHTLLHDPLAERLVGLDYSPVMAEKAGAKRAGERDTHKIQVVVADSERLPFNDGAFDFVTCCNSFHHYPHQAEVIRGFRRVLKPGGRLILIDGFRDNVIGWAIFDVGVATIEKHVHHAPWSSVRDMLQSAGFETWRQRKVNVLAPLLVSVAQR